MSRIVRRRLIAAVAAVALLTGCGAEVAGVPVGGSGAQQSSADPAVRTFVSRIQQGMAGVSSYRAMISADLGIGTMTGTFQGTVVGGREQNSEGTFDMTVGSRTVEVKVLVIGTTFYFGGPTLVATVPGAAGKTWILGDPNSADAAVRQMSSTVDSARTNSISGAARFAEAAQSVDEQGTEKIDGVQTTRYQVVLDPTKLVPPGAANAPTVSIAAAQGTYFLDGKDRLRRSVVVLGTGSNTGRTTMDVLDYDFELSIEEPDPNTVYTG